MNIKKNFIDKTSRNVNLVYRVTTRLARLRLVSLWRYATHKVSSSSFSYDSVHISMRAATGILWSSGNEPRSKKHSLMIAISLSETTKLLWRRRSNSVSKSRMEESLDHAISICFHISVLCPQSDPPATIIASGNPWQPSTICNCKSFTISVEDSKFYFS